MDENTPLRHSRQRHALLQQIDTAEDTVGSWTRRRNPRKSDPENGLPDYLYITQDPDRRPSSTLQRAVRELDQHGLLTATSTADGHENLGLSPDGERALTTWTGKFGDPDTL